MRTKNSRRRRSSKDTEDALLKSAEVVFGEKGFVDATIDEIVERTGISRGTFYIYFENKEDIFRKLTYMVVDDVLKSSRAPNEGTHRDRIATANRNYFEAMHRNRKVLKALLQVVNFNAEFSAMYAGLRDKFVLKIERDMRRKVAQGVVRDLDTRVASYALGLMIEAIAYSWLVAEYLPWNEQFEFDRMVEQVTDLWCHAVFVENAENETPGPVPAMVRLAAQDSSG